MLTELQLGYIAGILDGEGQVSIVRNIRRDDKKRLREYDLRVQVSITQRRRLLLDTILKWTGKESGIISATGLGNKYFALRFRVPWLQENLPLILPHLVLKKRQAELVLEFIASRASRPGRKGAGDETWEVRDALRAECMALNTDRTNALT